MRIIKDTITQLPGEGYQTLQIPSLEFGPAVPVDYEEVPDEYVMILHGNRPACGKESGFLFLSPAGYQRYREDIIAAYNASGRQRSTIPFDEFASTFFNGVLESSVKHADTLARKSAQAAEAVSKLREQLGQTRG